MNLKRYGKTGNNKTYRYLCLKGIMGEIDTNARGRA